MDGFWLDALSDVLTARARAMDPDAVDEAELDYDAVSGAVDDDPRRREVERKLAGG